MRACAREGEQCSCLGEVHFGTAGHNFAEMHKLGNVSILDTRGSRTGHIACEASNFNHSNSTGPHKCYCLSEKAPDPLPKAEHCADDEGMGFCNCYGTVYYGRRSDAKDKKD